MKKIVAFGTVLSMAVLGCLSAAASSLSPSTGEQVSKIPYIFAIVALILIASLVAISILSKKMKK